jgi:hypothetical protein
MNLNIRPINLPAHTVFTSTSILGLGLYVAIFREAPLRKTLGREILVPDVTTPRIADTNTLLGLLSCTMMMPYFLSSYMPIKDNQWLHVSVPVRLLLSTSLCANLLFRGRGAMSREGFFEFLTFGLLDLVGALILGYELGTFSGIVPARRK